MVKALRVESDEEGPERTCIVTRAKGSPDEMIRFVVGPGDIVVADLRHKLPGRGVWVTATRTRVAEAVKKQAFTRGFKAKVNAPADLPGEVDKMMERDCLQSLSIANKAGLVVTGYSKVESAINTEAAISGMVHATDGGSDGIRKVGQLLRRRFGVDMTLPQINLFDSAQLDLALGRTNVIHAALKGGAAAKAFFARAEKLRAYRGGQAQDGSTYGAEIIDEPAENAGDETTGMAREPGSGAMDTTNGHGPGTQD